MRIRRRLAGLTLACIAGIGTTLAGCGAKEPEKPSGNYYTGPMQPLGGSSSAQGSGAAKGGNKAGVNPAADL